MLKKKNNLNFVNQFNISNMKGGTNIESTDIQNTLDNTEIKNKCFITNDPRREKIKILGSEEYQVPNTNENRFRIR